MDQKRSPSQAQIALKHVGEVLDGRKYKTKHAVQEFWDSLLAKEHQVLSKSFKRSIKMAFDEVDIDDSGTVDRGEFYAGILLLYHNINMIPWGGRKPPPKRDFVMNVFDQYMEIQKDETGDHNEESLRYEYFEKLCREHFEFIVSSVLGRILLVTCVFPFVSWLLTEIIIITPLKSFCYYIEDALPSIFLAIFVFALPYWENLAMRRINTDSRGFASFDMKKVQSAVIGKVESVLY